MTRLIDSAAELVCKRGEHQVAGLRNGQGGANGFEIPHFSHQDHVRIFPQRILQGGGEGLGVGADLALIHETGLMPVNELDRIFHRDDVTLSLLVDLVDDGGQRRGLP